MSASTSETSIAQMRIASVKAGLLSAGAVGLVSSLAQVGLMLAGLAPSGTLLEWLVKLAVALCSGFFFGVTYRYVVRRDDNLHLGSGAVGAFAFVRSLAQIESLWNNTFALPLWLLITGESFLWFATARYTLDWAIKKQWIEPLN